MQVGIACARDTTYVIMRDGSINNMDDNGIGAQIFTASGYAVIATGKYVYVKRPFENHWYRRGWVA